MCRSWRPASLSAPGIDRAFGWVGCGQRAHDGGAGKGGWVLNGTKTFITNATMRTLLVVLAVTDRAAHTHGLSAFIVEKGAKGFRAGKKENKLVCAPATRPS